MQARRQRETVLRRAGSQVRTDAPTATCRTDGAPFRAVELHPVCRRRARRRLRRRRPSACRRPPGTDAHRHPSARSRGRREPRPAVPSQCSRKAPPPSPELCGSTSASTSWIVMAASTALPPARSMSSPAWVASGFADAAMCRCAVDVASPARKVDDGSGCEGRSGAVAQAASSATASATAVRESATHCTAPWRCSSPYFGCMRIAPSRRIVSPFSITFSTMCRTSAAYSSGLPRREGNGTCLPEGILQLLRHAEQHRRGEQARRDRHAANAAARKVACDRQRHADDAALRSGVRRLPDLAVERGDRRRVDQHAAFAVSRRFLLRPWRRRPAGSC